MRSRLPFPAEVALAIIAGVGSFVVSALVCSATRGHVPDLVMGLALLVVVLGVARTAGILYALPSGVAAILAYDWFFLPPLRDVNDAAYAVLGLFIVMAVIVGSVTTSTGRRALAAERARGDLAETQASLRRLALLIARGESPRSVFAAVTREVLRHFGSGTARLVRFERDGGATDVAVEGAVTPADELVAKVRETGRAAQDGDALGMPIHVDGRVWGMFLVCSEDRLPPDSEARMAEFTELVATAVADAQSRAELVSSRARIVAAADEARRRIERDLHDGAQQRLVALSLRLRTAEAENLPELAVDLTTVIDELRELSRGIHPAVLTDSGLRPALRALGRRSPVPVEVSAELAARLPQAVEVGAYYVVSEMVTNAVKHADASVIAIDASVDGDTLVLVVRDDGVGGADEAKGSGLVGLKDRIAALGGTFELVSPAGGGTTATCRIPVG
ncbi:ATP-binding protein [Actinoplanes sp. CA-142083]|uniref:ATP-binding protein n=1 Tax=Actinoplanes sp. CA-142083 TaxID=3239903 RepID=UPI003D8FDF31